MLPAPSMEGGMTATTQMFYDAGVFNNKNIYHFDTKFKWHTHTFIRFFESPVLKFRFILALIKYKPDIIFVIMSPYWGFYDKIMYCLIAKLFGVKSIFNSVSGRFTKFYESNFINRFWVNQLIKIPDYVVLGTPYWSRYFKNHFPNIKIAEIPNPVISEEYLGFKKEANKHITFVSAFRITKEKGIVELCRVIQKITARSNQFKFVILGDGPELAWLRKELKKQIENGIVELKGFITGEEKIKSIINADAYIMLSHFDMMPIALLEAMSASLPIFSTRTGGIPDMVQEGVNGHLFEVGEIERVVDRLKYYENNTSELKKMGEKSYQLVINKYTMEVIIRKQMQLINEII